MMNTDRLFFLKTIKKHNPIYRIQAREKVKHTGSSIWDTRVSKTNSSKHPKSC